MIGRVKTNPITGCKYAETLAGPQAGTVQKLGLSDDCNYEVVLSAGDRDVDGESYVGVSTCCPVTYNPETGTFKVCTLEVGSINGNLDADRIRQYDHADLPAGSTAMIGAVTCATIVDGKTYTCLFDTGLTYNYDTETLTIPANIYIPYCHTPEGRKKIFIGSNLGCFKLYEGGDRNLFLENPVGGKACWITNINTNAVEYWGTVCGLADRTCCLQMCYAPNVNGWYSIPMLNACNITTTSARCNALCFMNCSKLSYNPYSSTLRAQCMLSDCIQGTVICASSICTNAIHLGTSSDICIYGGSGTCSFLCDYAGDFWIGFCANADTYCEYKPSMAIGNWAQASGAYSVALGTYSKASSCSVAVGYGAESARYSVVLGHNTYTCATDSIAIYGSIQCCSSYYSVTLGGHVWGPNTCESTVVGWCSEACCARGITAIGHCAAYGSHGSACRAFHTYLGACTGSYVACGVQFDVYQRMGCRTFKFTVCPGANILHCNFQKAWHCFVRQFVQLNVDANGGCNHTYRFVGYGMQRANQDNYNDPLMAASGGVFCGAQLSCVVCWWRSGSWGTFTCTDTNSDWFSAGIGCYDYIMTING